MGVIKADFSGYATKAGLKCTDGRTIMPEAFKHMDGKIVPLVWQHGSRDPKNVLGHAKLEARPDGVYAYAFFNSSDSAKHAKIMVEHKDINSLSIYANALVERAKQVLHGQIREVSLVIAGANPGALIDNISIQHGDGEVDVLEDEAVIYTGLELSHEEQPTEKQPEAKTEEASDDKAENTAEVTKEATAATGEIVEHADKTVQDVFDSLSEEQKNVVEYMIGVALNTTAATHAENSDDQEGSTKMTHNLFEGKKDPESKTLTHAEIKDIVAAATKSGSLKAAVEEYALAHGIENIGSLFPDAKTLAAKPEFLARRMEWVARVLGAASHSPFSRVKTRMADITMDEARARGYIKGNFKKEEFFSLTSRTTTPTTVYKKQKLDRDDIVDITDFDVVAWLKAEMRVMLEEEIARAILIGDGREVTDPDKIRDPAGSTDGAGIRSILNDHHLFAPKVYVPAAAEAEEIVDSILASRSKYRGSGLPTFYTSEAVATKLLLRRDTLKRRLYRSLDEVASELRVASIEVVDLFETVPNLLGIMTNLTDYTIGADKGGEVNLFDDFDIDYNQYKYLIETRISGGLTRMRSALVIMSGANPNPGGETMDAPDAPTYNAELRRVTIPQVENVVYRNRETGEALPRFINLKLGEEIIIDAKPLFGEVFPANAVVSWTFQAV